MIFEIHKTQKFGARRLEKIIQFDYGIQFDYSIHIHHNEIQKILLERGLANESLDTDHHLMTPDEAFWTRLLEGCKLNMFLARTESGLNSGN